MTDLTEFTGEDALRASLLKKRTKAQEKLDDLIAKAQIRIAPLQNQIEKFDALLAVLDDKKIIDAIITDVAVVYQVPERMLRGPDSEPEECIAPADEVPAFLRTGVEKWGND